MQLTFARRLIPLLLLCLVAAPALAAPAHAQAVASPAATIAYRLGSFDNPIVSVFDFTQANDSDGLLGLPGAYASKAYFKDSGGIEGLVEVFNTTTDARFRAATLGGDSAEYATAVGLVVLRLFGSTDVQQYTYTQRLKTMLRVP
jgi:hypothetical protein